MFIDQIKAGAALLDEKIPGWESRQDLNKLDISHACNCVLGQLDGSYYKGIQKLFPGYDEQSLYDAAIAHGFNVWREFSRINDEVTQEEVQLTQEWKQFIQERSSQS